MKFSLLNIQEVPSIENVPTREELEEFETVEKLQAACKEDHNIANLDPEDGCLNCGYYSK